MVKLMQFNLSTWAGCPHDPVREEPLAQECREGPGPSILINPHRACRHVKCVRVDSKRFQGFAFQLFARCLFFAGCWMQEGTLTWSLRRNSLPLLALRALGPLRAHGFMALHFCIIFRDVFLYCFLMDFDLHFGTMLASFSMFVALLFRPSILHGFVINFERMFIYLLKYFC